MSRISALLAGLVAMLPGCAGRNLPPLEVVDTLDLKRYAGTWYEIARLPFSRQEGCVGTTATYRLKGGGEVEVTNRCHDGRFDGPLREAVGKAWAPDPGQPARLKVQFFWPFRGDYWVMELDPDYQYAVVGMPSRKYLWILSRTPQMDAATLDALLARAKAQAYDVTPLIRTPQHPATDR